MHNFLSIILINYLGDFQFRQQVFSNKKIIKTNEYKQKIIYGLCD